MTRVFRILLFIVAFQAELKVRASSGTLQRPERCLNAEVACAIHVTGAGFHFKQGELKLHATRGSTLERPLIEKWRLLSGTLWVESGSKFIVETVFGDIQGGFGQYWVLSEDSKIVVRNMDSSLKIKLRDGKELILPEGFELWISGLNSRGQSEHGMITPIRMNQHLPLWNSLHQGSKDEFLEGVALLRKKWGDVAEKSGAIYQALARREFASEEFRHQVKKQAQDRVLKERQKVRDEYNKKVFEH